MTFAAKSIEHFSMKGWGGGLHLVWNHLHEDVNILVGINGAGKTTLLNAMLAHYTNSVNLKVFPFTAGTVIDVPVQFVRSFDVPAEGRKKESPVMTELNALVMQSKDRTNSFFDYRMGIVNFPEKADRIRQRIDSFYQIVDSFFADTEKKVAFNTSTNRLEFADKGGQTISLEQLSAGEKQLLVILLTVFLQDEEPAVLLMDEPELSLHMAWQERLISAVRSLNPSCQVILTTHSPSIFANGWEDKLVFMNDLRAE